VCPHWAAPPLWPLFGTGLAISPDGKAFYFIRRRGNTVLRKPKVGLAEELIFRSLEGSSPVHILPFPDGKELLISTGNDTVLGSTTVMLYRVNLATHASQKIGELSGSPFRPAPSGLPVHDRTFPPLRDALAAFPETPPCQYPPRQSAETRDGNLLL
jgi:hypothetical protein